MLDKMNTLFRPFSTAVWLILLLERVPRRVETFKVNSQKMNLTVFPAIDGSNREVFYNFFFRTGIRYAPETYRGWMRSVGALAATLSHINTLRRQVGPTLLGLPDVWPTRHSSLHRP